MKVIHNNLYTHFVFTTLHQLPLIVEPHRELIENYIAAIVKNSGSQLYCIYANQEHMHFLIFRSPNTSDETVASFVANSSERFINENKFCSDTFKWEETCYTFSVSKGDIEKVCNYILNQAEYHRTVSLSEEYETFIKSYQKALNPE